ncbi:hypothetical protein H6F74_28600 [Trichocoleus sp. FACHB-90]|uniref:hypothetical protein n=1 Tax=Cyanophyceae TaxID=3028117 RepID=UPI001684DBAA|nr:hypothetical protein [Trichocoleus sp. FACHB-90]MBD1930151.1 hypothetical protein [Trichocoleus sp. FACHB-90]
MRKIKPYPVIISPVMLYWRRKFKPDHEDWGTMRRARSLPTSFRIQPHYCCGQSHASHAVKSCANGSLEIK